MYQGEYVEMVEGRVSEYMYSLKDMKERYEGQLNPYEKSYVDQHGGMRMDDVIRYAKNTNKTILFTDWEYERYKIEIHRHTKNFSI